MSKPIKQFSMTLRFKQNGKMVFKTGLFEIQAQPNEMLRIEGFRTLPEYLNPDEMQEVAITFEYEYEYE